jgi:hypothetical protein
MTRTNMLDRSLLRRTTISTWCDSLRLGPGCHQLGDYGENTELRILACRVQIEA